MDEVEISREGNAIILRPRIERQLSWAGLRAALERGISEDCMAEGREQPPAQSRAELDGIFR